jgi:hypothetical protein
MGKTRHREQAGARANRRDRTEEFAVLDGESW